jgi:predicted RNA-binding protein with TRAM domain
MSNVFGKGAGGGDSPTFKITMKEYEDMAIKVGDKVRIEIKKADNSGV